MDNLQTSHLCRVQKGEDGHFYVRASLRDVLTIQKYQDLSSTWKRDVNRLLDSILAESSASSSNVIAFPGQPARR
jgi:hypothetical protein